MYRVQRKLKATITSPLQISTSVINFFNIKLIQ